MGWNSGVDYQQENGWYRPKPNVSGYTGPGDVLSGAYAWYSSARAYSAAYAAGATKPAMDLVDQAGANPITINILPSGFVDVAAITAWVAAHSVTTINVSQLYDQSGNSRHVLQATLASMPALTLNSTPSGTLPSITFSGTQVLQTSGSFTQAQPLSGSSVFIRTSGTAQGGIIGGTSGAIDLVGSGGAANLAGVAALASLNAAATDNAWHAVNTLANGNGTSSAVNVDGTDTTGAAGTTGLASAIRIGRAGGVEQQGFIAEAGFWAAATTSINRSAISTNQHGSSGYNF